MKKAYATTLDWDTIIPFGKFKGYKVADLLDDKFWNPGYDYFQWLWEECENITLTKKVTERLETICKKKIADEIEYHRIESRERALRMEFGCEGGEEPLRRRGSRLDHWNDVGGYGGITFQELYGDFGY